MNQEVQWELMDLLNTSKCPKRTESRDTLIIWVEIQNRFQKYQNCIYPQKQVKKLECVGHIKQRLGCRLRKLKSTKKESPSDSKTLEGKGCLTDKMTYKLQNYFGIAIRQWARKTVYEMKIAIGAVLFHCSEASNLDTKHQMCPREPGSWCKYQADTQNNRTTYKDKPGLPVALT